jgi:Asp-tRNA(Asn)/Glu-tRNA(Gln) amidotransferase C subunit
MERDIAHRHEKLERLTSTEKERDAACGEIRYIRSKIEELKASLAKGD